MITIQPEKEEDYTAIHEINVLAFGRENEARLVKKIREAPDFVPELSLVAIKKREGHWAYSFQSHNHSIKDRFISRSRSCTHGCSSGIPKPGHWL